MKKGEKVGRHTLRKKRTLEVWDKIVLDFKEKNLAPAEIAAKYKNPTTNRPYTTRHIYWILRTVGLSVSTQNQI